MRSNAPTRSSSSPRPSGSPSSVVLEALSYLKHERTTVAINKSLLRSGDLRAIEERFRAEHLHHAVTIPYDEQLATMLDTGSYSLDALGRPTRLAIKQLGLAVAEQTAVMRAITSSRVTFRQAFWAVCPVVAGIVIGGPFPDDGSDAVHPSQMRLACAQRSGARAASSASADGSAAGRAMAAWTRTESSRGLRGANRRLLGELKAAKRIARTTRREEFNVFFEVLAAIVTADAFDRHMREQQHRAWIAQDAPRGARAAAPASGHPSGPTSGGPSGWDAGAPERPTW